MGESVGQKIKGSRCNFYQCLILMSCPGVLRCFLILSRGNSVLLISCPWLEKKSPRDQEAL